MVIVGFFWQNSNIVFVKIRWAVVKLLYEACREADGRTDASGDINLLAPELFFFNFNTSVYKM